jgi:hypothetical protein
LEFENSFRIWIEGCNRTYFFRATDEQEALAWVTAIKDAQEKCQANLRRMYKISWVKIARMHSNAVSLFQPPSILQ